MVSLCITTFQRDKMLFEAFRDVINHPLISEAVIVDDRSDETIYNNILFYCKEFEKIKVFRNDQNLDCYRNKRQAIKRATNQWCILLDSDNILPTSYLDRCTELISSGVTNTVAYFPSFAKPHFDFRKYAGQVITRANVASFMEDSTFQTMLNAMNYFINRDEFLRTWDGSVDPVTSDSIYQNYRWLESGNSIYVVPDLEYDHRVHDGSHYRNNVRRTPSGFHEQTVAKLKQLT